jgi:hypothetical protein
MAATPRNTQRKTSKPAAKRRTPRTKTTKPETSRSAKSVALGTLSAGAAIGALAAGVFGLLKLGRRLAPASGSAEHVPTDLMGDRHPGADDRAIDAFRPDPTAPIPAGERDQFRPALAGASAPTLVKGQATENQRLDASPS